MTQYVSRVVSYTSQWSDGSYVQLIKFINMTHSLPDGLPIKLSDPLTCTQTMEISVVPGHRQLQI